jgi:hypothetical protein
VCPNSCSNNGVCNRLTGVCTCNEGFYGDDCSLQYLVCPLNCSNNGICNRLTGVCTCNPGYFGFDCA